MSLHKLWEYNAARGFLVEIIKGTQNTWSKELRHITSCLRTGWLICVMHLGQSGKSQPAIFLPHLSVVKQSGAISSVQTGTFGQI